MFTGIVSSVGNITDVAAHADPQAGVRVRVRVAVTDFPLQRTGIGDSIAIQGACMTVTALENDAFTVDVSRESLNRTAGLDRCGPVNLEHALRLGDALDGHLVSGHVDDVGCVVHFAPVGESWDLRIDAPLALARYLAQKGSVTVNGVSLTINQVEDLPEACRVWINLIPHTVQVTTLNRLRAGDRVNLEVDMLARYVQRMRVVDGSAR